MSSVGAPLIPIQSLSDEEEDYIEVDDVYDNPSLGGGSVLSEERVEDPLAEKLPLYLIHKVTKDKNNFSIENQGHPNEVQGRRESSHG
eukprot:8106843-Ditylum_brightwellii.AAC.1